ncbi:protein-glutamate methylesterase/protein-glutamine glutaminase [Pimelobacter simplex]|uniref:Protein-glutamate methylesterase/protein-glutamine glutaminase n=3 Tax=Nocardioides simplex TaxID=2045 RepID=A0A0A1DG70_NOCSI|nr:chemotaxis response regulator protein-glutamate methylesterase [Pimelobacter simplex]AIY16331.1 Chemotaxis response regulator protein-glutamate methylesterase CheB [Pimelobacter simplex]SFN04198.1 response regulator receiver modulated CheB methylesterase [Pimelobacter simplex]
MTQIRVLVVDDSALVRRLVRTALQQAADIEVAGVARDGVEAVRMVDELRPDVVTLDIEMPNLDGLGALTQIREKHARLPVIMFSTLTERGATATLDALSRGASDYVTKPSNTGQIADGIAAIRDQLVPRIRALAGIRKLTPGVGGGRPVVRRERALPPATPVSALLIGCSTGGPDALARLLPQLPADLGVPVLVVQHMPPVFTAMLAQRLDKASALTVREAADGDDVRPGEVLIAPGDFHLRLRRTALGARVVLDQGPQENFCRPAVDVLFRSALEVYGGGALATVLTGMGQDGLAGARELAAAGARIVVQDEESSVVWGMPGAVAGAGLADDVLPLERLAERISATVRRSRTAAV